MAIKIEHVSVEKIVSFRHEHLLPSHQLSECKFSADTDPETFHLAAYENDSFAGIATFLFEPSQLFKSEQQYRLRQMAVEPLMRRQGVGRLLMQNGLEELRKRSCLLLWCNAREVAFEFYQSLNFEFKGDVFEVDRVGPHKVMYVEL